MARDHRKLEVFGLADSLAVRVYQTTSRFPHSERFGLSGQIRRAAVSVPTNIVEGCARDSATEYLRFLEIAFASAREVQYLVDLSARLGFLEPGSVAELNELARRVTAALAAMRRALRHREYP